MFNPRDSIDATTLAGEIDNTEAHFAPLPGSGRTGLLAWRGSLGSTPVKIYETFGPAQAKWIERMSQDPDIGPLFPPVVNRISQYLIVEWISGQSLSSGDFIYSSDSLKELATIQSRLHSSRAAPPVDFDYKNYLLRRVKRQLGPLFESTVFQPVIDKIQNADMEGMTTAPSHPDLTPRNMVRGACGISIVDNETFGANAYCQVDLFNTLYNLSADPKVHRMYLQNYAESGGDLTPLVRYSDFFHRLWQLRLIGTYMHDGRIDDAVAVAGRVIETNMVLNCAKDIVG